jgi:hypothetical protein
MTKEAFVKAEYIVDNTPFKIKGSSSFIVTNSGNSIVTIFGVIPLRPKESFGSDPLALGIVYNQEMQVTFDKVTPIVDVTTDPGLVAVTARPNQNVPKLTRDNKLLIVQTFIKQ